MLHRKVPPALIATLVLLLPAAAAAVPVSGRVVDEQGVGIFGVDLDFLDRNTGMIVFTPGDDTDFNGFYAVDVPVSEYDVSFRPPVGSPYLPSEVRIDITGPTTLDQTLYIGLLVSGVVTDQGAAPLFNVDLNFRDATGTILNTNNDNTDSSGVFGVYVPTGTYDVLFTAPAGQPYAGVELPGVAVPDSIDLGSIVLPPGLFVSGTLLGPGAVPLVDADLDFEDTSTGTTIYTPRDNTDALGAFNVAAPAGTYDITFGSPSGSGLAWQRMWDVPVSTNLNVGTVTLQPGFAVTGTVQDPAAQPVAGADLDLLDALGRELPTPNDNANAAGAFSVLVAAGTIDIAYYPPAALPLAAVIQRGVAVGAPLNVGAVTLPTGHTVSGVITAGGLPVAGADLDAFDLTAGTLLHPTQNDDSDPFGAYSIRLPAGNYLVVANPPVGSGLFPDSAFVAPLGNDRIVNFDLGGGVGSPVPAAGRHDLLHPAAPNPFRGSTRFAFDLPSGPRAVRLDVYDVSGRMVRSFAPATLRGRNSVVWDARDGSGRPVAAGVYHVRLRAGEIAESRKVVVLR